MIATLARLGSGADVVSEGEFRRALAAGIPGERIVFSGIGKTASELAFALAHDVRQINVELLPELELVSKVAASLGTTAPIAIRVNPDVDARTHAKITTGLAREQVRHRSGARAATRSPACARCHPCRRSGLPSISARSSPRWRRSRRLSAASQRSSRACGARDLRSSASISAAGSASATATRHPPSIEDYAALVRRLAGGLGVRLAFEPGRVIVGNAGVLVARVLYVKEGVTRRFVILDAAMNDLMRPALYDAWHEIVPLAAPAPGARRLPADVVGPVCETGDSFAAARDLPPLAAGDLVALLSAGAYGAAMSSGYNTRLPAPEVLVRGRAFEVIRQRPSYDEVLAQDRLPSWLAER